MSNTPRTDLAQHNMGSVAEPHYVVDVEVAHDLERELAEVKEQLRLCNVDQWTTAALAEPAIKESLTGAEPVAWTTMPEAEDWCFVSLSKDPTGKLEGKWFPLYTDPPRREWVGLTDEEITEIRLKMFDVVATNYEAYRAIEAKLREKNT